MEKIAIKCLILKQGFSTTSCFLRSHSKAVVYIWLVREVVKTATLGQDPPNHKIDGVCLHPPCLTSKDGVFIA